MKPCKGEQHSVLPLWSIDQDTESRFLSKLKVKQNFYRFFSPSSFAWFQPPNNTVCSKYALKIHNLLHSTSVKLKNCFNQAFQYFTPGWLSTFHD